MRKQWLAAAAVAALSGSSALAGELKFSGKVFADLSFKQNVDEGKNTTSTDSGTGVDVKRFYLGAEYKYNDMFSAKIVTDIGDKGAKRYDVFVKNAYIEAALHKLFVLRLGEASTPWIPYSEDRYGFRFVENTLVDRTGFGNSADWGVHLLGDWNKMVNYQVSLLNGRGYGDPTRSKNPTFEGRIGVAPIPGLNIGVGGEYGKLGQQVEGTKTPNTASKFNALANYEHKLFRVGVEGFFAWNRSANIVLGKAPNDMAQGLSVYGNVNLPQNFGVFARYDYVQPNHDTNPDVKDNYLDAGLTYKPVDALTLALVYKHETVDSGPGAKGATFSTSNGSIGSGVADSQGRFQEFGLFTQFVF